MTRTGHIVLVAICLIVIAVLLSGCPGQTGMSSIANNTSDQSWPRLFDRDNLTWYKYDMINGTTGLSERQLTVTYGDDPYIHIDIKNISGGVPVQTTKVNVTWLDKGNEYNAYIYDNKVNGSPVYLLLIFKSDGFADSLAPLGPGKASPNNTWLVYARSYDLAARDKADSSIYVSGFDFLDYNGNGYYCSVYKSEKDRDFQAWRNASMPVPIKVVANLTATGSTEGIWTFELQGWG